MKSPPKILRKKFTKGMIGMPAPAASQQRVEARLRRVANLTRHRPLKRLVRVVQLRARPVERRLRAVLVPAQPFALLLGLQSAPHCRHFDHVHDARAHEALVRYSRESAPRWFEACSSEPAPLLRASAITPTPLNGCPHTWRTKLHHWSSWLKQPHT